VSTPVSGPIDLEGRVAIVTGGAGGIGQAVVMALAEAGAAVVVTAQRLAQAEAVAHQVCQNGGRALPVALDVTDRVASQAAVTAGLAEFGRIDIAVSCAGVLSGVSLTSLDDAEWSRAIDINLKGTVNLLQAVFPTMTDAAYGKIVCLGSIAGENGGTGVSGPAYVASKAAIHALVKLQAKVGGPLGIYVNAVSPGPVVTPMWIGANGGKVVDTLEGAPLGRTGLPEDVAQAVLFFASAMSNYVTGQVLSVNGGLFIK
jgi:3-oxoacyl-[acyl-carrier protein] reductase